MSPALYYDTVADQIFMFCVSASLFSLSFCRPDGLFSFVTVQFFVYVVCPSVPHQTLLRSRPCKRVVSKDIYYNLQAASFHLFVAKIDPF